MTRKALFPITCLLAAGALASGCGDDDDGGDDGGNGGEALSREAFVDRANEICRNIDTTLDAIPADLSAAATLQEVGDRFADEVIPVITDGIQEIGEIEVADEEVEGQVDEMVSLTEEAGEDVQSDPERYLQEAAEGEGNPYEAPAEIAQELELTDCFPDV